MRRPPTSCLFFFSSSPCQIASSGTLRICIGFIKRWKREPAPDPALWPTCPPWMYIPVLCSSLWDIEINTMLLPFVAEFITAFRSFLFKVRFLPGILFGELVSKRGSTWSSLRHNNVERMEIYPMKQDVFSLSHGPISSHKWISPSDKGTKISASPATSHQPQLRTHRVFIHWDITRHSLLKKPGLLSLPSYRGRNKFAQNEDEDYLSLKGRLDNLSFLLGRWLSLLRSESPAARTVPPGSAYQIFLHLCAVFLINMSHSSNTPTCIVIVWVFFQINRLIIVNEHRYVC